MLHLCLKWVAYADAYATKVAPQAERKIIEAVPCFFQARERFYLHFEERFNKYLLNLYADLDQQSRHVGSSPAKCLMIRLESLKESATEMTRIGAEMRDKIKHKYSAA